MIVSADEEAYLRAAFRRFAVPYMLGAFAVISILSLWLIGRAAEPKLAVKPVVEPVVLDELRAESLALRAQLGKVLERLDAVAAEIGGAERRVNELENQVESATGKNGVGRREIAALIARLDEAYRRLDSLESRPQEASAPDPARGMDSAGTPTASSPGGAPPADRFLR